MGELQLPYEAIIFDVRGTLVNDMSPRTDTLAKTLSRLRAKDVWLFAVSRHTVVDYFRCFPDRLIAIIQHELKEEGIKKILDTFHLNAKNVLYVSDNPDGEAISERTGITFIKVSHSSSIDSDMKMELEHKLADIFGREILGKPQNGNEKKNAAGSDLPKPPQLMRQPEKPRITIPGVLAKIFNGKPDGKK